jgi:hypothetical protein
VGTAIKLAQREILAIGFASATMEYFPLVLTSALTQKADINFRYVCDPAMEALRAQWASEAVLCSISKLPAQKALGI